MFLLAMVHGKTERLFWLPVIHHVTFCFTTCIIMDVIGHVSCSILTETMDAIINIVPGKVLKFCWRALTPLVWFCTLHFILRGHHHFSSRPTFDVFLLLCKYVTYQEPLQFVQLYQVQKANTFFWRKLIFAQPLLTGEALNVCRHVCHQCLR